jgi:hypothetical protein
MNQIGGRSRVSPARALSSRGVVSFIAGFKPPMTGSLKPEPSALRPSALLPSYKRF